MISVIISTYKPILFQQITENIKQTIGVEYEIIGIENNTQYSICEAYNMGVERAKYPFLCFVHEDVIFLTSDWGKNLVSIMKNDNSIGLVGVAGTKFKSSYPSAWGQSPTLSKFKRGHIKQRYRDNREYYIDFNENAESNEIEEVICLDGVFLFSKKEVFTKCKFDEKLLTDFHGYDIDFSLQVFFQSFKVVVFRGILLLHYSSGNYTRKNTIANRRIALKWRKKLPVATTDSHLSTFGIIKLDVLNWIYFLTTALKREISVQRNKILNK